MHRNRLMALVGVLIGIIGLFMKALTASAEAEAPAEAAGAVDALHESFPTIWGGLDTWAQWVLVIFIIVVVVLCLRPDMAKALGKNDSMIVGGIGVVLLVYAIIKWMEAAGDADDATAYLVGNGIPDALFGVTRGLGFIVLVIGTVLVTFAGSMGFVGKSDE